MLGTFKTQIDSRQMKIEENYTIHEQNLTQHESKFEKIDQTLHKQTHKQELHKCMDKLELGHTGQGS